MMWATWLWLMILWMVFLQIHGVALPFVLKEISRTRPRICTKPTSSLAVRSYFSSFYGPLMKCIVVLAVTLQQRRCNKRLFANEMQCRKGRQRNCVSKRTTRICDIFAVIVNVKLDVKIDINYDINTTPSQNWKHTSLGFAVVASLSAASLVFAARFSDDFLPASAFRPCFVDAFGCCGCPFFRFGPSCPPTVLSVSFVS